MEKAFMINLDVQSNKSRDPIKGSEENNNSIAFKYFEESVRIKFYLIAFNDVI